MDADSTSSLLTTRDVMQRLRVSRTTIWRLIKHGRLQPPVKIGRKNVWTEASINAFVADKINSAPPMRPRRLSKKEQAQRIAEHAREPKRRKRRDPATRIPDDDAGTADGVGLTINSDHHPNALSERDRARLEARLGAGSSSLRWRL